MKLQLLIPQYSETEDIVKNMLDSIEIQQGVDFNEFEVLIGNDGSDVKLSEDFLTKYSYSIQYFQFEHTSPAGTRQRLFDKATADYIMFCDADDMFLNILAFATIFAFIDKGFDSLLDLSNEQTFYSAQKRFMEDLGIEVQEVTAKLKIMKENLLDNLSTPLAEILDWLQNNETFMSPEEKAKRRYFAGENLREAHGEMERGEKVYTDKAEWLARNINWEDVRGASSSEDFMMKVKTDKNIEEILPSLRKQMSTQDYTELLYNIALAKLYGLMKDEDQITQIHSNQITREIKSNKELNGIQ
jgi:glycosyltransferase involved in cell wall biosynthesis